MKISRLAALTAAYGLLVLASGAQASTVFSNGGPDGITGSDLENDFAGVVAEDFSLASAARLTGATVFLGAFDNAAVEGVPIQYDIYADSENAPGQLLASGVGDNLSQQDSGARFADTHVIYAVSFDFESAFEAAANTTYWFGIHADSPLSTRIFFMSAPANGSRLAQYSFAAHPNEFTSNVSPTIEHAFSLSAADPVPEPSTWALSIMGFGLAGAALRRRARALA
jgi:hypothetical protein